MPIDSSQLPDANLVHSHSHSRLSRRWKAFRRRWSALRALPRAFLKELGWVSSKIYLSWAFFVPFSENTPKNVASLAS